MSFATDINTLLQGNGALNTAVGSRVYSYNLPDNLDINLSAVVFTYKKESGTHTLDADNVLENYTLYVVVVSASTETNETISDLIRAFVDIYQDSKILDIVFEGDTNGVDPEKERYYKSLEYRIIYKR